MTTVCGVILEGVMALAADGREIWHDSINSERYEKLFLKQGNVVGTAGESRYSDLAKRFELNHPSDPEEAIWEYADQLKKVLDSAGFESNAGDGGRGSRGYGSVSIFMNDAGIWVCHTDFAIGRLEGRRPVALGSGMDFAIGAMDALLIHEPNIGAEALVLAGLSAASKRDIGTGPEVMLALRGKGRFGPGWVKPN